MENKTPEEIASLKHQWKRDPIWDIETTEGFEAHYQELKNFRRYYEAECREKRQAKLEALALKMGIPGNFKLIEYIQTLEYRIERLENKFRKKQKGK